ncbi:hypothetical protein L1987_24216 [Smallanthus sonchifolius]|uniref:Uncharacterized protein n=1 Tax=Smallanthus sonchifolius TaxID=185202 RepID=A0ACB9IJL6_9ASTR|nr:hypothetical protein L1987_24216 [Smallanthus sonchifolius]
MNRPLSDLHSPTPTSTQPEPTPDDDPLYFNSEFILFIGLFIILCFIICLISVSAAARCTWFSHAVTTSRIDHFSLLAAKLLRSIPKLTYSAADNFSDCAICLTEFVVGDEIRVLPRCEHCFHVACIDRWIGSHFTCPSCRQMLLKSTRCNRCDAAGNESTTTGETSE